MSRMTILFEVRRLSTDQTSRCLTLFYIEQERVILHSKAKDYVLPRLTEPLREGGKIKLPDGAIAFNEILGKRPRDVIKTRKGMFAGIGRLLFQISNVISRESVEAKSTDIGRVRPIHSSSRYTGQSIFEKSLIMLLSMSE